MLVIPRATEKTYGQQAKNTYVFYVPENGSKQAIRKAVEEQFNVTVKDIRVLTRKGKSTRYSKGKHAYPGTTFRRDKKLAYVTLKDGDKIKVFDDSNEGEEKSSKSSSSRTRAEASDSKNQKKKETKETKKTEKKGEK